MWNDVMFCFSQMICFSVYIPLFIKADERARQYLPDVIDLTRAICADNSQGNEAVFGENAGKQCVVMSFLFFYHHTKLWTTSRFSDILVIENNLYSSQRYSVETNDYLLLTVDFQLTFKCCN